MMTSHVVTKCSKYLQQQQGKLVHRWLDDRHVGRWVSLSTLSGAAVDPLCRLRDEIHGQDTVVPNRWDTWRQARPACSVSSLENAANVAHVEAASRDRTCATRISYERQRWGQTAIWQVSYPEVLWVSHFHSLNELEQARRQETALPVSKQNAVCCGDDVRWRNILTRS